MEDNMGRDSRLVTSILSKIGERYSGPQLSNEEFTKRAILRLRDISKSHGIHSVFSGFNQAFRIYFGEDPVTAMKELEEIGAIEIRPVRRGVMLYLKGEAPAPRVQSDKILKKILEQ